MGETIKIVTLIIEFTLQDKDAFWDAHIRNKY